MTGALGDDIGLRQDRLKLSHKNNGLALLIFALPYVGYCANFVLSLWLGWPWGLLTAISGAWFTGMLFIVGHDACHQSFTSSRRLNGLIGRLSMLPSLHNFSLWDLGHNRIHHRHNNVRGFDYVWEPMSPDDYRAAGPIRRLLYRLSRSPLGVAAYYLPGIWLPKMFLLRRKVYREFRREYLWDALLVWAFLVVQIGAAICIGALFSRGPFEALLQAVLLPFLLWNVLMSFVIYLHHTHPEVPWYGSVDEWRAKEGSVFGTVHVRFPWFVRKAMLDIMEHGAHHFAPGVPLYRLEAMQQKLADAETIQWAWTLPAFFEITRRCRLFDYSAGAWVSYPSS